MSETADKARQLLIESRLRAAFGVPPHMVGVDGPPLNEWPDPRCWCSHWGCRSGWWHCHGTLGNCFVPEPVPMTTLAPALGD